ncbi:hypothetical protein EGR_09052 [Echinococcus granulosus]|uniref:Uncharacterized protein n=1 Tax=Echinococcus granulosus TaxID=6210 RepID=W6UCP7_ECHGR|nr:hypothetical protein EGR_09052 [Echinococcus granulosus]EUB56062.1 hypothetical protein EGR_09052 [Echinococcus granulosus]
MNVLCSAFFMLCGNNATSEVAASMLPYRLHISYTLNMIEVCATSIETKHVYEAETKSTKILDSHHTTVYHPNCKFCTHALPKMKLHLQADLIGQFLVNFGLICVPIRLLGRAIRAFRAVSTHLLNRHICGLFSDCTQPSNHPSANLIATSAKFVPATELQPQHTQGCILEGQIEENTRNRISII